MIKLTSLCRKINIMAKKKTGKTNGRPKGSKGPLNRYLEYLWTAKEIKSTLIVTHEDENGILTKSKRVNYCGLEKIEQETKVSLKSKIDMGHEILVELFRQGLVEGNTTALRILLDRRYGKVKDEQNDNINEQKGELLKSLDAIILHSKKNIDKTDD